MLSKDSATPLSRLLKLQPSPYLARTPLDADVTILADVSSLHRIDQGRSCVCPLKVLIGIVIGHFGRLEFKAPEALRNWDASVT